MVMEYIDQEAIGKVDFLSFQEELNYLKVKVFWGITFIFQGLCY